MARKIREGRPDDIPTLVKQCEFYERDTGWLPEWFNLQPLMTRQYGIDRAQITLQSAVEITGVQQELDYHSAINDAYYTALVLTKINDIPSEIDRLCSQQSFSEPKTDLGGYGKDRPYERSAEIIRT